MILEACKPPRVPEDEQSSDATRHDMLALLTYVMTRTKGVTTMSIQSATKLRLVPAPDAPAPAPKRRRRPAQRIRIRGELGGAYLVPRRNGVWHMRWPDPSVPCGERSESTATRDLEVAKQRLRLKAKSLLAERDRELHRRAMGLPDAAPQWSVTQALDAYLVYLRGAERRSRSTLYHAQQGLRMFAEFCSARGVVTLTDVTAAVLDAYYASLLARPGRRGERAAISSVNQWAKPLRTALRRAHARDHAPHLSDSWLRVHLPHVPVATARQRELYQLDRSRPLERDALKACMRIVLDSPRYRGAAIDIMLILLYGLRRMELARTRVMHATANGLALPADVTKGYRPRKVPSQGFTVLGQGLLDVLRADHAPAEWLSEGAYSTLGHVLRQLGVRGHDLRATCETFQLSLRVSLKHATARMGHTLAVADESYLALLDTQPLEAPTLEAAMGLEPEFREVIELARSRAVWPRTKPRKNSQYRLSGGAK